MLGYITEFWEQFNWGQLADALGRVLAILICLTVHETCHGLAALALGNCRPIPCTWQRKPRSTMAQSAS